MNYVHLVYSKSSIQRSCFARMTNWQDDMLIHARSSLYHRLSHQPNWWTIPTCIMLHDPHVDTYNLFDAVVKSLIANIKPFWTFCHPSNFPFVKFAFISNCFRNASFSQRSIKAQLKFPSSWAMAHFASDSLEGRMWLDSVSRVEIWTYRLRCDIHILCVSIIFLPFW